MSNEYILTWSSGICRVLSNGFLFETNTKPKLPFEFVSLFYEPIVSNQIYIYDNVQYHLTDEQVTACQEFCDKFHEVNDYPVLAYDNKNIFVGSMLKSLAIEKNYKFMLGDIPEYAVSKYNETKAIWEEVVFIIREDGSIVKRPGGYCDQCTYFYTQEEFDANPILEEHDDNRYWRFDVESNLWINIGDELNDLKKSLELRIREKFEKERIDVYGRYTPNYERLTWDVEITEAIAYLHDVSASTPYTDGILIGLEDPNVTKDIYIKKIMTHNETEKYNALGIIHGKMYKQIYTIRNATTIEELKVLQQQLEESLRQQYKNTRQ